MIAAILAALVSIVTLAASPYRPALMTDLAPLECDDLQFGINWAYERLRHIKEDLEEDPTDLFLQEQKLKAEDEIRERQEARKQLGCV